MATILIVGGDHLGNIKEKLEHLGFQNVFHIKGRRGSDVRLHIPKEVNMILVLTDYVNHNLAKIIKLRAKERELPIVFSRRAWSDIHSSINVLQIS